MGHCGIAVENLATCGRAWVVALGVAEVAVEDARWGAVGKEKEAYDKGCICVWDRIWYALTRLRITLTRDSWIFPIVPKQYSRAAPVSFHTAPTTST